MLDILEYYNPHDGFHLLRQRDALALESKVDRGDYTTESKDAFVIHRRTNAVNIHDLDDDEENYTPAPTPKVEPLFLTTSWGEEFEIRGGSVIRKACTGILENPRQLEFHLLGSDHVRRGLKLWDVTISVLELCRSGL